MVAKSLKQMIIKIKQLLMPTSAMQVSHTTHDVEEAFKHHPFPFNYAGHTQIARDRLHCMWYLSTETTSTESGYKYAERGVAMHSIKQDVIIMLHKCKKKIEIFSITN